jgi:ubiquinone/menaquinone biosynthesis C-methylase UbiE
MLLSNAPPRPRDQRPLLDRLVARYRPGVRVLKVVARLAPGGWRTAWVLFYQSINRHTDPSVTLMNYGYAPDGPDELGAELESGDERQRCALRLYLRVAGAVDLHGLDALEVGCGRGGGASFVMRHLGPRSVTGVDCATNAVAFCNGHYDIEGLSFARADAEDLHFPDGSFDVVVNVESSHCYPSVGRFLDEVARVLRAGGYLLLADLRQRGEVDALRAQLRGSGFSVVEEELITPGVLRSLDLASDETARQIRSQFPRWLQPSVANFAGVKGSAIYEAFRGGLFEYVRFVARKEGQRTGGDTGHEA